VFSASKPTYWETYLPGESSRPNDESEHDEDGIDPICVANGHVQIVKRGMGACFSRACKLFFCLACA
jgi:hypothetical protein